jgi:hypothetical protein
MIRRGTKRSELADDRETLHASAIRALRAAQEAIATLEKDLDDMERERDHWRTRALYYKEQLHDPN